jgi:hypothetical protein
MTRDHRANVECTIGHSPQRCLLTFAVGRAMLRGTVDHPKGSGAASGKAAPKAPVATEQDRTSDRKAAKASEGRRVQIPFIRSAMKASGAQTGEWTMTILKIAPLAAAALAVFVVASQANAAPFDDAAVVHAQSNASTYSSTYRDPTTREALDEGAW